MIALIDCNNFYVSCERVFDPAIQERPVIVLSNNDGCAIARSEEAKAIGIKMAQPAFMIPDLQEKRVKVFSSNYTLYGDMSRRVMQVIREFVPSTEVYSIDEIFADLASLKHQDHFRLAATIKEAVGRCTGIPVSIGIAPTKTLAKMANRLVKKKDPGCGVFCADTTDKVDVMLAFTPVEAIWGIGKEYASFLRKNGFYTAKQLRGAPEEWVRKNMSVVGQRMLNELRGIRCFRWEEETPARKNICTSRSFGQLITSKNEIKQAVATFTSSCAEKLRTERSCAKKIQVFLQTNPHRPTDQQYFQAATLCLPVATNATNELLKFSMQAFQMVFKPGYKFQKCGVVVMDLVPEKQVQLGLFDTEHREKNSRLMRSLDKVNKTFGKNRVRFGVQDYGTRWALKQEFISQLFTTRFDQLPKAKAS